MLTEIGQRPRLSWRAVTLAVQSRSAPPAVVSDFRSYTPQLGFHPDPGAAVLVAEDGDVSLYATTNAEGSYCFVVSAPWKRPETLPDGGTCIPPDTAAAPLIVGVVGAAHTTLLVGGRADVRGASAIRFAGPDGRLVTRPIGSSGFFVAAVRSSVVACSKGDWRPAFVVPDASGRELTHATIGLIRAAAAPGVCILSGLHS